MSQKLLNSYTQFLDGNGNPLAGGSLVFSESGTDTPKTVYAAENQASSLGSTVTLDSAGRPSNGGAVTEVYSAATGAYRITVKDSSGVNQVVAENVSALLEFSALTMTGQLKADDSTSTAAPPYTFDGDTDTGLARPAANTLAGVIGGSEGWRLNSTGFGVGTTAPTEKGHFVGNLLGTGIHYSESGTFTVTASGTTTEVITGLSAGVFLVNFAVSGTDMELRLTGIIHSITNLVSKVDTLLTSDFNAGSVLLQPEDNLTPLAFNAGKDRSFQFVCTGDGVADRTATYRLLRLF
jgi:hypothetical protein